MQRRLLLLALLSASASGTVLLGHARAVTTARFSLDDASSLAAEDLEGAAVLSSGKVALGLRAERLALDDDATAALVYALLVDGPTTYLGTGDQGRILRARGESVSVAAETGQLLVTSLVRSGDTLYAGTIGEGRLLAFPVSPDGDLGEARTLELPEEAGHVWALQEGAQGRLFVATGPEGLLLEVDPRAGTARTLLDTDAAHVLSLADAGEGAVYAGTSEDALVYRVTPGATPRVEVVHDFPGNEITALAAREGVLVVAANELPAPRPTPAKTKGRNASSPRPRPGKGRLFQVTGEGRVERIFARDDGHFTSLALDGDGQIYVGEAKEGRVYRVSPDRSSATVLDLDERQVLAIAADAEGRLVLATGDGAALYRVSAPGPRETGRWTSKVQDARFRARWGRLSWRGEGSVTLRTRSGNREEPDESWSEWSAPLRAPGPVRSPAARYLQIEARLQGEGAELRSVEAFYLPRNQRPVLRSVGLKAPAKKQSGQARAPSARYALSWRVDNPDGDALRFRLRFRAEDQETWRAMLPEEQELTETTYTWDTRGVPDGLYVVEVEASDELANPAALTLRARRSSETIRVDNHAPRIEGLTLRGRELRGRAVDTLGPIRALEQSIGGGPFRPLLPADQLLDDPVETFAVDLRDLPPGLHLVAVRATDAGGNGVTAEQEVTLR
ncbi:MAG: hypothetical protein AAF447_21655 [Myxococcota bacterium]